MADTKITGLTEDTSPAAGDYLSTVDVDDLMMGSTGSNKRVQIGNLPAIPTAKVAGLDAALATKATLASPAFTGTPTGPTAAAGTNTTQLATTAFVLANAAGGGGKASAGVVGDIQISDGGGGFISATAHPIHYDTVSGNVGFAGGGFQIDINGGLHPASVYTSYIELSNYPSQPATRITRRTGQTSPVVIIRDEATNATIAGFDQNAALILISQADSVAVPGSFYFSTTQSKVVFKDAAGVFH